MSDYYALMTKVGQEFPASDFLRSNNLWVECPVKVVQKKIRQTKRYSRMELPYIPGYVFVARTGDKSWFSLIRQNSSLIGFVQFGNQIACVPQKVINELKAAAAKEEGEVWVNGYVHQGDAVEVSDGMFKHSEGHFIRMVNSVDACVDLFVMNRFIRAVLPSSTIRKI